MLQSKYLNSRFSTFVFYDKHIIKDLKKKKKEAFTFDFEEPYNHSHEEKNNIFIEHMEKDQNQ
jgi:hypothetical protein